MKSRNGQLCLSVNVLTKQRVRTLQNHGRRTRNDGFKLKIPQTKLKYAQSGFFSMGVTVYNELPLQRKIENFNML